MSESDNRLVDRRRALIALGGATLAMGACGGAQSAHRGEEEPHGEEEISATEDLMREHGVLRRVLIIYDEIVRRARANETIDPAAVSTSARLVREFVEDYHERGEERWVFPVVRRVPALASTVDVLLAQHQSGRVTTDAILRITNLGNPSPTYAMRLATLCEGFARMYRAHAAREDTVIFPALRAALSRHEFDEIGERMEEAEHATVGEGGFEHAVAVVTDVERSLGIDDLARFTVAFGSGAV
jgi:hemerythrin-like domain-containing protein